MFDLSVVETLHISSKIFVEHALHVAWILFSSPEPVVSWSSVSPMALGTRLLMYSFRPRLKSRAIATVGLIMTIGLSVYRSTHSKKHFDHRAKTRLTLQKFELRRLETIQAELPFLLLDRRRKKGGPARRVRSSDQWNYPTVQHNQRGMFRLSAGSESGLGPGPGLGLG